MGVAHKISGELRQLMDVCVCACVHAGFSYVAGFSWVQFSSFT